MPRAAAVDGGSRLAADGGGAGTSEHSSSSSSGGSSAVLATDGCGLQLRDYQQACIEAILEARQRGVTRQLVSLPTGSGKTVVFSALAARLGTRTLVLAHRAELLAQAAAKMQAAWPGAEVAVLGRGKKALDTQVVVASVQTAMQPKTLERLVQGGFELIIVDEAHHAPAPSYMKILFGSRQGSDGSGSEAEDQEDALLARLAGDTLMVGFTATPQRHDSKQMGSVFQELVFQRSLPWMVRQGYLVPLDGHRIMTDTDLSGIKVKGREGDFKEGELEVAVNTPERNALTARAYATLASGRPAIVFCVGVTHAHAMAEAFREAGVSCEAVHGKLPPAEREGLLRQFKERDVQVLTNCMILTEGYDETSVSCIVMARPTRSTPLYQQCIGRGLRLHAGKQDCMVIDMTDRHHDMARVASLTDVCTHVNLAAAVQRGRLDMLCMRRYTWTQFPGTAHLMLGLYTPQDQPSSRQGSSYRGDRGDGSSGSSSSREPKVSWKIWLVACEPLQQQEQQQQQPEDACASSSSDEGGGGPATGKSSSSGSTELRYLTCIMRQEGRGEFSWELVGSGAVDQRRDGRQEARRPAPLQDAVQWAEDLIEERFAANARTNWAGASWRGKPPSEQQKALLQRKLAALAAVGGPDVALPAGLNMTRGVASQWIDMLTLVHAYYSGRFAFPRFYV